MPIRRRNARAAKKHAGTTYLLCMLATALGCQVLACASAKVSNEGPRQDGGTGDTASAADGRDSSPNGKNDAVPSDALYSPCDPFSNAGCSSGQKCSALQSGDRLGLGCASKGEKSEGESCAPVPSTGRQTGDDCGDGLACFALPGPNPACHRICPTGGTTDTCPGTETCSLVVSGLAGLAFCQASASCQALDQTGCSAVNQEACYYGTKGAVCALAGSVQPGGSCIKANECAKGSTCLIVGSSGICSSFCSTASGGTPSCSGASTGGTICSVLPGEANLGSCREQP